MRNVKPGRNGRGSAEDRAPPLRRRPLSGCVTGACEIERTDGPARPRARLLLMTPETRCGARAETWCPKPTLREPEVVGADETPCPNGIAGDGGHGGRGYPPRLMKRPDRQATVPTRTTTARSLLPARLAPDIRMSAEHWGTKKGPNGPEEVGGSGRFPDWNGVRLRRDSALSARTMTGVSGANPSRRSFPT